MHQKDYDCFFFWKFSEIIPLNTFCVFFSSSTGRVSSSLQEHHKNYGLCRVYQVPCLGKTTGKKKEDLFESIH